MNRRKFLSGLMATAALPAVPVPAVAAPVNVAAPIITTSGAFGSYAHQDDMLDALRYGMAVFREKQGQPRQRVRPWDFYAYDRRIVMSADL